MRKEEFAASLKNEVQALLPRYEVKEVHVTKMNDMQLTGLTFIRQGEVGGPTIYIDEAYEDFSAGKVEIKELAIDLVNFFFATSYKMPKEVKSIADSQPDLSFDAVKDHLSLRLIEKNRNQKYLEDKPYKDAGGGLALVAAIELNGNKEYSIIITDKLKDECGYDMDEIFDAAESNTSVTMKSVGGTLSGEANNLLSLQINRPISKDMFVVSNNECLYGAAGLFTEGTMKRICDIFGSGYYILPSSIHEMLLMPDSMVSEISLLKNMVLAANASVVDPCDLLSDNVYHYDIVEGFRIAA